jgi:hypothetical protein
MAVNCCWGKTTIFILLAAASLLLPAATTIFANGLQQDGTSPEPEIKYVSPDLGYQGKTINISITGNNLSGATDVNLGPGVEVRIFTIDNREQITSVITIAADAETGYRDISITTPEGTYTLSEGFQIMHNANSSTPIWIWIGIVTVFVMLGPGLYILFQKKASEPQEETPEDSDLYMS